MHEHDRDRLQNRDFKNPVKSGVMAFRTRDEDEYTRRVINCEWSFQVNQERRISLNFSRMFQAATSMLVTDVGDIR